MNWVRSFASNVAANIVTYIVITAGSLAITSALAYARTMTWPLKVSIFINVCFIIWAVYRLARRGSSPKRRGKAHGAATTYHPVDLINYFNYFYRDPAMPTGKIRLGPAVFDIAWGFYQERAPYHPRIILLGPNAKNGENGLDIPIGVDDVAKVHFLITAHNGLRNYSGLDGDGRIIGSIELHFEDEEKPLREALRLGYNVRDWTVGSPIAVCDLRDEVKGAVTQVWTNTAAYGGGHLLDALTINIGRGKTLERIRLGAQLLTQDDKTPFVPPRVPYHLPALQVVAISCELET